MYTAICIMDLQPHPIKLTEGVKLGINIICIQQKSQITA